jgi:hypothetical protein
VKPGRQTERAVKTSGCNVYCFTFGDLERDLKLCWLMIRHPPIEKVREGEGDLNKRCLPVSRQPQARRTYRRRYNSSRGVIGYVLMHYGYNSDIGMKRTNITSLHLHMSSSLPQHTLLLSLPFVYCQLGAE